MSWAGFTVTIKVDPSVAKEPVSGRLVVFTLNAGVRGLGGREPADGPFYDAPQPMFAMDVRDVKPGSAITLDASAQTSGTPLSGLASGTWRFQAVLVRSRGGGGWRTTPGNLSSNVVEAILPGGEDGPVEASVPVEIVLSKSTTGPAAPKAEGVDFIEVPSKLVSEALGRPVTMRAAVIKPIGFTPGGDRRYPVIYTVPGFGGDWTDGVGLARRTRMAPADSPAGMLARSAFQVVLDPDSPNGHTLFADSANNGPRGRALVEELIPHLEATYPLVAKPEARLVTGHSSGGWSTVWLATRYPETFGAAWASSPDPVDFRAFQRTNIYEAKNIYLELAGDVPSFRDKDGVVKMTVRQENLMEEILGPDNTSGQQWDSWAAVFSPLNAKGNPAALYDPATGLINPEIARAWKAYDIGARLRSEGGVVGPILKQRVRILVGDADNFYLNEAVALLKKELDGMSFLQLPEGEHGSITISPTYDHSTIFRSDAMRAWPKDMLEHLRRHGLAPGTPQGKNRPSGDERNGSQKGGQP